MNRIDRTAYLVAHLGAGHQEKYRLRVRPSLSESKRPFAKLGAVCCDCDEAPALKM